MTSHTRCRRPPHPSRGRVARVPEAVGPGLSTLLVPSKGQGARQCVSASAQLTPKRRAVEPVMVTLAVMYCQY